MTTEKMVYLGVDEDALGTQSGLQTYTTRTKMELIKAANIFQWAAEEIEARLKHCKGHPAFIGVDVYFRAKAVGRRYRLIAEYTELGAKAAIAGWLAYRKHFGGPFEDARAGRKKSKKTFNFEL